MADMTMAVFASSLITQLIKFFLEGRSSLENGLFLSLFTMFKLYYFGLHKTTTQSQLPLSFCILTLDMNSKITLHGHFGQEVHKN